MEKNWVARLLLKYLYKGENKRNGRNSFEFNPFILQLFCSFTDLTWVNLGIFLPLHGTIKLNKTQFKLVN